MMRTILVVIAVAVMALFTGGPSAARESVCGPRAVILEQLRKSTAAALDDPATANAQITALATTLPRCAIPA